MSDDLTTLRGVGDAVAENLREAGFETTEDVLGAEAEDLIEVDLIGKRSAQAILEQSESGYKGAPAKFDDVKDELLEAARDELNLRQVANAGGIAKSTLHRWIDEHEEWAMEFRQARSTAADRLVKRALDPDDEIDRRFAQFLLERSFRFIKTEKREIDADNTHRMEGDGFVVEFGDSE